MAETEGEGVSRGDKDRSSPGGGEGLEGYGEIVRFMVERAASFVQADLSGLDAVRLGSPGAPIAELFKLLDEFVPRDASPAHWERWLAGGELIGKGQVPQRPSGENVSRLRVLEDRDKALRNVDNDIGRLEARLAGLKQVRAYHVALQKAHLQYLLLLKIAQAMEGVFALGPAWVVMRSIGFPRPVPDALLDEKGEGYFERIMELEQELGDEVSSTSAFIMKVLHSMAGDARFESELHVALYRHCRRYKDEAAARGRKTGKPDFDVPRARDGGMERVRDVARDVPANGP